MVAAPLLLGLVFTKERKKFPITRETILMLILWGWYTLTTIFAIYPKNAWERWDITAKILLMTFVTLLLFQDRKKLKYLLLVTTLSVGFFGFKGGIFTIRTGGEFRVMGPPTSFIGDNNAMAMALLMVCPVLYYLAREETNRKLKIFLQATLFLSLISIIGSYSRGALLGLIAVIGVFFLRLNFKAKFLAAIVIVLGVGLLFAYAPEKWFARMGTIENYEEDGSAMGRIGAWKFAWNLASDRFLGGGFNTFTAELFLIYAPDAEPRAAHSIYFQVLGDHGFAGLGIFLALLGSSFLSLLKIRKTFKHIPSCQWLCNYADGVMLGLVPYAISGAFLSLAYFDLYYNYVAVVILLKALAKEEYETWHQERTTDTRPTPARLSRASAGVR
jgi:probable O-glycosylation ligase (exosortase A-associated)